MTTTDQDLPWINEKLVEQIIAAFNNTHAILLNGPVYIGKSHLVAKVCQQLLQESPLMQAGTHPDLHVLTSAYSFVQLDEQLKNSALRYLDSEALEKKRLSRQISVESIRSLIAIMNESAALAGYKLAVIFPAEDMNRNAANALLKFLEEPHDQTLITLISHDISKLPATIRSRCMRIDITIPNQSESMAWLKKLYPKHAKDEIGNVLHLASGRPLLAGQYLTNDQQSLVMNLTKDIEHIFMTTDTNIVVIAKKWLKMKRTDFILHWLCCFFSDLIKLKSGHTEGPIAKQQINLVEYLSLANLFDLYDYFVSINQRYDGVSDETLLLEDMLLRMSMVRQ